MGEVRSLRFIEIYLYQSPFYRNLTRKCHCECLGGITDCQKVPSFYSLQMYQPIGSDPLRYCHLWSPLGIGPSKIFKKKKTSLESVHRKDHTILSASA